MLGDNWKDLERSAGMGSAGEAEHEYRRFSYNWGGLFIQLYCTCGWRSRSHLYWNGAQKKLVRHLKEKGVYV